MVARACVLHCLAIGDDVKGLTRTGLDITDRGSVRDVISAFNPDAVLNCAAYTDVDRAETEIDECFAVNSRGVENLAIACRDQNAVFVTISTDYIFDGGKDGFYTQDDTPKPQSVYAKSKLEGERRAAAANPCSIIVRSGWIYGDGGTNFLSVMHRPLKEGKRIKAISDSFGTPTFAHHLAKRLRELAAMDHPAVFHVTNSGPGTSYLGFAEKVCEIGGLDRDLIEKVSKDDLKRPAARPVNSRLACLIREGLGLAPLPPWEQALESFIESEIGK